MTMVWGIALGMLGFGLILCLWRVVRGPSSFDRVVAFDCAVLLLLGALLVVSMIERTGAYLDVILIVGLLGFIGTISLAAFLEGATLD
jgi:multisubunit Na+/H+ antiporter MnhF subunit